MIDATPTLEIVRRSAQVAEVWLNRPDVRNAFNHSVIAELRDAFERFAADATLRAIVLGGRGKAFCAGADLSWMKTMAGYTWEQNRADAGQLAEMLWTIWRCPVPVGHTGAGHRARGHAGPGPTDGSRYTCSGCRARCCPCRPSACRCLR